MYIVPNTTWYLEQLSGYQADDELKTIGAVNGP